jgi:hypothetical protein
MACLAPLSALHGLRAALRWERSTMSRSEPPSYWQLPPAGPLIIAARSLKVK